ncbi:Arylsulfatase [Rubripirellula tenax]|uniref:Arylsulfatase n=1 Tax=Rubripirellula tenax TaxID=2528015 RepID=A0A5C6EP23_9BACT|nr:sulfatase-like hydrolase/transferase [Rubripirellula tenax]TWU50822.1 Arylsulfatase [Rubripirellula tenax]
MKFYLVLLALALSVAGIRKAAATDPDRPNILYFYVDDMGWGSIGPNGQAERKARGLPYVRTPNLDRLAAQGLNFTRGYGCHVCSPARSSQQTGFHQGHTFADRNDPDNAKKAIRAADITMGDALAAADYVTGYWGKWGYGGSKDLQNPTLDNLQTLPTSHGYQHVVAELHHVRAHTFFQPTLWTAPAPVGSTGGLFLAPNSMAKYQSSKAYPSTPALQNHPTYPETAYCDDVYAFAALDFVHQGGQNYNESGQPFFGLLAVQIPHGPFGEIAKLPDWDNAYADDTDFASLSDQSKQWAAMVTRIDSHFGNILAALEDPNNDGDKSDSVADNTLVIFQSDNGGPAGNNVRELGVNGGLKGFKGSVWEGGIRVPLVMRWPAKINESSSLKVGSNTDMVVDVSDLLPTFCELAGQPVPLGVDGVSIAPTLRGAGQQRHREFIIHEASGGQSIIRGKFKLVSEGSSKTKKSAKGNGSGVGPVLSLFDLEVDRGESNNIAAKHPELVKELSTLLMGERVYEPKGFANTYHRWTGDDGDNASDASNWSDYVYANAGITYATDRGTPQLSWISQIVNTGDLSNMVRVDADVEFLGLEIRGNSATNAKQSVVLSPGVNLTGRNEIRLAAQCDLFIDDGTVSSLRWIDVGSDANLNGSGTIDATVYNSGVVSVSGTGQPSLKVTGDLHQSADGTLKVSLGDNNRPGLVVDGVAELDGVLAISIANGGSPSSGDTYAIVTAGRIEGQFANSHGTVVAADGAIFRIQYSENTVTLVAE